MRTTAIILLGSNQGDREQYLHRAFQELTSQVGGLVTFSSIYESAPWGNQTQSYFLNQVVEVTTECDPETLLKTILRIENQLGRQRKEKWGARTIDLDILYYGSVIVQLNHLMIPHPSIGERRFTLVPLVEEWPDFIHPQFNLSNRDLLGHCNDPLSVTLYKSRTLLH